MYRSRTRRGTATSEWLLILGMWMAVVTLSPVAGGAPPMAEVVDLIWFVGSGAR